MGESIGPQLPPHLLPKRKRDDDEADERNKPTEPPSPALPAPSSPDSPKRRRIIGPAAPPAPLSQPPASLTSVDAPAADDDDTSPFSSFSSESESDYGDDDSDDDYGPALPGSGGNTGSPAPGFAAEAEAAAKASTDRALMPPPPLPARPGSGDGPSRRDEWMTTPPAAGTPLANLAAMDPSKHRARGFRTGGRPGGGGVGGGVAAAAGQGVSSEWTETPEEKRRRLANEVLGIGAGAGAQTAAGPRLSAAEEMRREKQRAADELTRRRVAEAERARRGESLMERNRRLRGGKPDEADDPSKRAFDYEKDVAGGAVVGRPRGKGAGDRFGNVESRFSGGGFL
jgi:hypothetical protein